MTPVEK